MARINVGVLCVVILMASCSDNDAAKTPQGFSFRGKNYVLKNVHGWEEKRSQMLTDRMWLSPLEGSGDAFRENLSVTVEDIPADMNLDKYIQNSMEDLSATGISFMANYEPTNINGFEARVAHISHTIGTFKLVLDSYVILDNNHVYVISCMATEETYEEYRPQFESMVGTFALST